MPNPKRERLNTLPSRAKRGICFAFLLFSLLMSSPSLGQTPPARPTIFGISHVVLFVAEYCHSLPFYSALGGKVHAPACSPQDSGKSSGMAFFSQSGFIRLVRQPSPRSNALAEVGFWVSDVPAMREYLRSQGLDVGASNGPTLRILDPEGHTIAFMPAGSPAPHPDEPRIIHAGFIVRDREKTEHFYKDILGFRPYWHGGMRNDKDDWVAMQVPDGTDWLEFMVNVEPNADQRLRGIMNHIAIGVTDIHAMQKKLIEAGAKLSEEPQIGRDGKWQLNLYDPDLTRIEFMEFTPVQKPCCSEYTGPHPKP